MAIEHILVPTDFGESSERAEQFAVEIASKLGAKLTLLHVWSVPTPSYAEGLVWPIDAIESGARESLHRAHERMKAKHPATDAVLMGGVAADCIIETAKERAADLIVMGTHGRRGVPRLLLGSVAEKVVRLANIPVLTVPA